MNTDELTSCENWHQLFDTLCNARGWYDNSDLASRYCKATGKTTQRDFESARRTLRDWRAGTRTPLRRNFIALGNVLDVSSNPELDRRWTELYRAEWTSAAGAGAGAVETAEKTEGSRWRWPILASIAVLAGVVLAAPLFLEEDLSGLPQVGYDAHVRFRVGDSKLIHGEVASCAGGMADWLAMEPMVPATRLGVFSDGGAARKMMNECGKEMLVRAVRFTATEPGVEDVSLMGDYMKIEVVAKDG